MKDPAAPDRLAPDRLAPDRLAPDRLAITLGWLREPTAGRAAAIAAVVAGAMVLAIHAAVGGA